MADEPAPDILGPYHLLERIGEGGMGVVYLARDDSERRVALKVLRTSVAGEPTARRRLAREVETMRRVRSPYVAEVIGADLTCDTPYIVTRYVPGRTLEQVVAESGPLEGAALHRLASGLADALVAVHAAGVVHRDLKPSNVMLLNGLPVVIDFGIAQGADATRLTMTGMFMGTPGYLAPEVIEGNPSSEASDVHAWGATVAFAATGCPPYGTGAYEAIFYRIVQGQPNLNGVPAPLLPPLAAALARDPAQRPPAMELSSQVALIDPGTLVGGNVPAHGSGASPPVTVVAAPAGEARVLAAEPVPPDLGGPVGAAAPGTRPWPASPPVPGDFADVLPPVSYQGQRWDGGERAPLAAGRPVASPRLYSAMVVAAMVTAVGVSVVAPVAGTLCALSLIVLLRAADLAQHRASVRRGARGARRSDPVLVAAALPWHLLRALLACLFLVPFAAAAAVVAGGIAILAMPGQQFSRTVAIAAGVLVAFYGLGPGSLRPRRQLSRIFASFVRTRMSQAVVLAGLTALAVASLAAAASWPSVYWPVRAPGDFLHIGGVLHGAWSGIRSR